MSEAHWEAPTPVSLSVCHPRPDAPAWLTKVGPEGLTGVTSSQIPVKAVNRPVLQRQSITDTRQLINSGCGGTASSRVQ